MFFFLVYGGFLLLTNLFLRKFTWPVYKIVSLLHNVNKSFKNFHRSLCCYYFICYREFRPLVFLRNNKKKITATKIHYTNYSILVGERDAMSEFLHGSSIGELSCTKLCCPIWDGLLSKENYQLSTLLKLGVYYSHWRKVYAEAAFPTTEDLWSSFYGTREGL